MRWSAAAELVTAFANFATDVDLGLALGALLFPRPRFRLLGFDFRFFRGAKAEHPRFVSFLHRTLRMNAAARIGSFTTNGTKFSNGLWDDDDRLDDAHRTPNAEVFRSVPAERAGKTTSL